MPCCPQYLIFETLCIGRIVKTCVKGVSACLTPKSTVSVLRHTLPHPRSLPHTFSLRCPMLRHGGYVAPCDGSLSQLSQLLLDMMRGQIRLGHGASLEEPSPVWCPKIPPMPACMAELSPAGESRVLCVSSIACSPCALVRRCDVGHGQSVWQPTDRMGSHCLSFRRSEHG